MSDGSKWLNNDQTRDIASLFNKGLDTLRVSIGGKPNLLTAQDSQSSVLKEMNDFYDPDQPIDDRIVGGLVRVGEVSAKHENLSLTDERTGLLNLRGYNKALQEKIALQRRRNHKAGSQSEGLGFIFFDSIGLKKINDELGDPYGDKTIEIIAEQLKDQTRTGEDVLGRKGGDEFMMIETVPRNLTVLKMTDEGSSLGFLPRLNDKIVSRLSEVFGKEYVDKCNGAGALRGEGFYLSPEDLDKSSEELAEIIERNLIIITTKMKKTKRRG